MNAIRTILCLTIPAFALCLCAGCGGTDDISDEGLVPTGGKLTEGPTLIELPSDGTGTITGTVTYDGDPPAMGELSGPRNHADAGVCLQGNIKEQTWVVDN